MKQYTDESQTAKLIELGFARPRIAAPGLKWEDGVPTIYPQYTIGELIKMLMTIKGVKISFEAMYGGRLTLIVKDLLAINGISCMGNVSKELVDLLFDAIVKLKEKGG